MVTSAKPRVARWKVIVLIVIGVVIVAGAIAAEYAIHQVEPILRARVIEELSTRFNSQVQLGEFHVSFYKGFDVEGKNLSLRSNLYPNLPPQISIEDFSFDAGLLDLFRRPMRVHRVELHGLTIEMPPKGERAAMPKAQKSDGRMKMILDRIDCDNALLVILTDDPHKTPLQFKIHKLTLRSIGSGKPMHFDAQLINPKPIGDIASQGSFGPWNTDRPRDTPVDGRYSFTNADLSTTHGIAGILSSTGKFSGPLDMLAVDGQTDTPDFSVDVSGHKVDLRTQFHAVVDGTNGNTYLKQVKAHFLNTYLTAAGSVVRSEGIKGHDINLKVVIDRGRIEDLLQLGVKTTPPVMTGNVQLKTRLYLPPGKVPVSRKLELKGTFAVENISFTNLNLQKKMDELSLRSLGKAGEAKEMGNQTGVLLPGQKDVEAAMRGSFSLANGRLSLPELICTVPGAEIQLAGGLTLNGKQFDFTGHARMQAHLSSIVGGWKGRLLSPIDPFFAKHGAGTEVPIKITGTKSNPHFGLNF